jgi:hypothetical protein
MTKPVVFFVMAIIVIYVLVTGKGSKVIKAITA